jgi:hypothetical protein
MSGVWVVRGEGGKLVACVKKKEKKENLVVNVKRLNLFPLCKIKANV